MWASKMGGWLRSHDVEENIMSIMQNIRDGTCCDAGVQPSLAAQLGMACA